MGSSVDLHSRHVKNDAWGHILCWKIFQMISVQGIFVYFADNQVGAGD